MDPMSLAASVAGLLSLAVQIGNLSVQYFSSARGAKKAISDLFMEVTKLQELLSDIRKKLVLDADFVAASADKALAVLSRFVEGDLMRSCEADLLSIRDRLASKVGSEKGFSKVKNILTWPFSEETTQQEIAKLHRYQSYLQSAINIDTLTLVARTHSSVGRISLGIEDQSKTIKTLQADLVDWRNQYVFTSILDRISPLSFDAKHCDILSRRSPGTCHWLLDHTRFHSWRNGASNRLLWCPGEPGVGKTVASSIIIDHLSGIVSTEPDTAMAFVYGDYNAQGQQTAASLLGCILMQLIKHSSTFPRCVADFYRNANASLTTENSLSLLVQVCRIFKRSFVVIDALDEVSNDRKRERGKSFGMQSPGFLYNVLRCIFLSPVDRI